MPISLFFSFDLLLRASSAGRGGFAQCRQLPAPLPHSPEQAAIVKIIKIIKIIKIVKISIIIKITIIIMCIVVIAIVVSSPLDDLCIDIWISAMIISASKYQRDRGQQCTRLRGTSIGDLHKKTLRERHLEICGKPTKSVKSWILTTVKKKNFGRVKSLETRLENNE